MCYHLLLNPTYSYKVRCAIEDGLFFTKKEGEFYTQSSSQLGSPKQEKPTVRPPHPPVNKIQSMWTGRCCEYIASHTNPETASRWRTYNVFGYLVLHSYLIFKNLSCNDYGSKKYASITRYKPFNMAAKITTKVCFIGVIPVNTSSS